MGKDATILGMTVMNTPPEEAKAIHAALVAGLEEGSLNPVIGQAFPLLDAPDAHKAVMDPGSYGKIVLIP